VEGRAGKVRAARIARGGSLVGSEIPTEDIAVCYADQLDLFVGPDTRVVGIHAHNPLGITFATDVYTYFYGSDVEPINAEEFRRLILHPTLKKHKNHLKVIVGGPGAWQIEKKNLQDEWQIDCIFDGEAEEGVLELFEAAMRGEAIPRKVEGHSPKMESIPPLRHRSTYGAVEITRGCGRGCQFCSVALRAGKSFPLEQILANVKTQAAEGAEFALLVTEDLFLYEHGPKFAANIPALKRLFESVLAVEGIKYLGLTHGTMAPIVAEPNLIPELQLAVDHSVFKHALSTHPEKRYQSLFIGMETGSPRLFKELMKGKGYPFRPEQWPDVILKGMEILNRNNWFPLCTWILGLPGETPDDTRLQKKEGAKLYKLMDLQWEFFFTCWRYNMDFFHRSKRAHLVYNLGIPIYYYLLGRRLFGQAMKYPLLRLGHFPEWILRKKLYLDFTGRRPPKFTVPESVEIPEHGVRPLLPVGDLNSSVLRIPQ
jgi:Radical SAM superfamily